jgi:hypothetical protein
MGTTMAQHQLGWLASRLQEVRARIDARRAGVLNVTPRWLYRRQLPFARRLSRRAVRFSEAGLRRWLTRQNAAK